jgi:hypothetical protein
MLVLNCIQNFKKEYSSLVNMGVVTFVSNELVADSENMRCFRKGRSNSFCDNNQEKLGDFHLNRYMASTIEFSTNNNLCRFRIFTYFTKISRTCKKYTTEIYFYINYPANEPYSTKNNMIVELLKDLSNSVERKISSKFNRVSSNYDPTRMSSVVVSEPTNNHNSCDSTYRMSSNLSVRTHDGMSLHMLLPKICFDNFKNVQKMITGVIRLRHGYK